MIDFYELSRIGRAFIAGRGGIERIMGEEAGDPRDVSGRQGVVEEEPAVRRPAEA